MYPRVEYLSNNHMVEYKILISLQQGKKLKLSIKVSVNGRCEKCQEKFPSVVLMCVCICIYINSIMYLYVTLNA